MAVLLYACGAKPQISTQELIDFQAVTSYGRVTHAMPKTLSFDVVTSSTRDATNVQNYNTFHMNPKLHIDSLQSTFAVSLCGVGFTPNL